MDGGGCACLSGSHRHLFVNESHSAIHHVGVKPEWWFKYEGSSEPN